MQEIMELFKIHCDYSVQCILVIIPSAFIINWCLTSTNVNSYVIILSQTAHVETTEKLHHILEGLQLQNLSFLS